MVTLEKVVDGIDRIIDKVILITFLLIFLIGCYIVADVSYVFYNAAAGGMRVKRPTTVEEVSLTLEDLSEEAIAWITLDDTKIDYPIMHCDNNTKYLNIGAEGKYSLAGAIFMDFRNNSDFSDPYTIIYGHHMANDYMFGALDHFEDAEYFDKHSMGRIRTRTGEELELNILAFGILDAGDERVFTPNYDEDLHGYISSHAKNIRDSVGGRIVALTTCREPGMTTRSLLFCEIIED